MAHLAGQAGQQHVALSHSFGLQEVSHGNVLCIDDQTVAYPVGRHVSCTNTETRVSTFLAPEHFDRILKITALAISPARKHIAAAEVVTEDEPPQLTLFILGGTKKPRTLACPPDAKISVWRSLSFSSDSKVIVALGDGPDYPLLFWQWDKRTVMGLARVGQAAFRCAMSRPKDGDGGTCAVSGPKLMRFYKMVEGQLKGSNASVGKRELLDYTDQCWLTEDRLVACAQTGEVSLFEAQELRQVLPAVHTGGVPLRAIAPFSRGFVVAGDRGIMSLHERTEDNAFVPLKSFVCPGAISRVAGAGVVGDRRPDPITSLAVSPSEEALFATSVASWADRAGAGRVERNGGSQLSVFPLKDVDILPADGLQDHFSPLCGGFHSDAVTGLDVCLRKPLVATCSADRTVRVWNYAERTCEQARYFVEEPLSVALHPSGYHLVVGFQDKLRFFHVLVDDLRFAAEFHLKMCKEVKFSHGGHYFAAVAGPNVVLFGTYSLEMAGTLKGHAGTVRSLGWSADDLSIATAGMDGAVYEWTLDGLRRAEDHVLKGSHYHSVLCAERGVNTAGGVASGTGAGVGEGKGASSVRPRTKIVAGSEDGRLREVVAGQVTRELAIAPKSVTQLVLAPPDRVRQQILFAGTGDGGLHALRWPLVTDEDVADAVHALHRGPVHRMRMSGDGTLLFTASNDNALFIINARPGEKEKRQAAGAPPQAAGAGAASGTGADEGPAGGAGASPEMDTVLVSHSELLERLGSVADLEKALQDQEMQNAFKLHQRQAEHERQLKKEKEDSAVRADEAAQRLEALSRTRERVEREAAERAQAVEVAHMRAAEELEHLYERKLAAEAARYESLAQQKADMQSAFEERMLQMQQAHMGQLERFRGEMDSARGDAEHSLGDLKAERDALERSYEEELRQEDRDHDEEIHKLRRTQEAHLQAERDEALRLKGEAAILRKKFEASRTDMQKLRNTLEDKETKARQLAGQLEDADKMIEMLRKDMREREDAIADKERRMAELKAKNKELEKFKYVLDYKLRELKKELEPRDEAINRMRQTVTELDDELQRDFRQNVSLTQEVSDKQAKLEGLTRELKRQRQVLAEKERLIASFGRDLHRLVTHTEPALWRDAIKDIYRTYVKPETAADDRHAESDAAENEIHRQREYMERAIDTLKGRVGRSEDKRTSDQRRKVQENQELLEEVNHLRVQNRQLRGRVHSLGAQLELQEKRAQPRVSVTGAPLSADGGAGSVPAPRPRTTSAPAVAEGLPSVGDRKFGSTRSGTQLRHTASAGQLARGSALSNSRERTKMAEMLSQLDENNKEIGAQRAEIRRLRDQVQALLAQPGACQGTVEAEGKASGR